MDDIIEQVGQAMPEGLPGDWEQGAIPVIKIWAEQTVQAEQYTPIKTGASLHIPLPVGVDAVALAKAVESLQEMLTAISQTVAVEAVKNYRDKMAELLPAPASAEAPASGRPLPAGPTPKSNRRDGKQANGEMPGDPTRYGGTYLKRLRWSPKASELLYDDMFDLLIGSVELSPDGAVFKVATSNYDTVKLSSKAPTYDEIIGKIWQGGVEGFGTIEPPRGTVIRCRATKPYKGQDGSVRGLTRDGNPYVNVIDASKVDYDEFVGTAVTPEEAFEMASRTAEPTEEVF